MSNCPHCDEPATVEGVSDGCSTACYPINITNPMTVEYDFQHLEAMRRAWQALIGDNEGETHE